MLTTLLDKLIADGYVAKDDVSHMDEVYTAFTILLPEGKSNVEMFVSCKNNLMCLSSRLGITRNRNIKMCNLATSAGNIQLRDYYKIGQITFERIQDKITFTHTASVPLNESPEYLGEIVLNFAQGTLLAKSQIAGFYSRDLISSFSQDDVPSDHPNMVQLHRLNMLAPLHKRSIVAFMWREKLSLRQIESLFSGSLTIYPVIIRCEKRVLVRLESDYYRCDIADIEMEQDPDLTESVEKAFELYLALKNYLGQPFSKFDSFYNAGELLKEIEDALTGDN